MLEGKVIVITGAGNGIGAACAKGVAARGAAVLVNDTDMVGASAVVEAIGAAGGRALAHAADVSRWEEAGAMIAACLNAFGRIDGLVNNAGLFARGPVTAMDPDRARRLVEVNVLGPINCTGQAVSRMVAQGSGSIVNLVSGAHLGIRNYGIYGATKGAVASMVYGWALDLAGTGVRVNGLSPFARTAMAQANLADLPADERARQEAELPEPETNSPVLEYLLSDRACDVTGQIVRIDKGELQLYTHPALLLPPVRRDEWTAEQVAEAFDREFAQRLIPCGVLGMTAGPVPLESGYWNRIDGDAPNEA